MPSDTLIFIHVPKTAGTSFYDLIVKNYDKKSRFVFNTNKGKNPLPKLIKTMRRNDLKIVYGHGTFGLHEVLPHSRYVTFIREPIAHTISNYNYIRTSPHNRLHKKVRQMSFKEFVLNLEDMYHDNQHYRQFTSTLFQIANADYKKKKIQADYDLLEYALKKIHFIYRFEDIGTAVKDIALNFNWEWRELPHLNTSQKDEFEIDEEDLDSIRRINYMDCYIYSRCQELVVAEKSKTASPTDTGHLDLPISQRS